MKASMDDEIEALKHDLERLMARELEHVNRIEKLEAFVRQQEAGAERLLKELGCPEVATNRPG